MAFRVLALVAFLAVARAADGDVSRVSSRTTDEASHHADQGDGEAPRAASVKNVTVESKRTDARAANGSLRGSAARGQERLSDREPQQPAQVQHGAALSKPTQGGWQQYASGQGWQQYTSGAGNYATYMQGQVPDWQKYAGGQGGFNWQKFSGGASPGGSNVAEGKGPAAQKDANAGAGKEAGGLVPGKGEGFQGYIDRILPPGDSNAYVRKNTATWSNMTASQQGSYSGSYSKYVNRYEAMAGKNPAAPGDWNKKAQEQSSAYGGAVGKDVPGHADKHYQEIAKKTGNSSGTGSQMQLSAEDGLASRTVNSKIVAFVLGSACCVLALSARIKAANRRDTEQRMHPNQEPLLAA